MVHDAIAQEKSGIANQLPPLYNHRNHDTKQDE
jgi:hypothetical protein